MRGSVIPLCWGNLISVLAGPTGRWVTWGWPFHAYFTYVYDPSVSVVAGLRQQPVVFLLLAGNRWPSAVATVIVPCAIYGGLRMPVSLLIVATILATAFCNRPQGIPMHLTGPAASGDARWPRVCPGDRPAGREARPTCDPARVGGCRTGCLGRSCRSAWRGCWDRIGTGSVPAARFWGRAPPTPTRTPRRWDFIPAIYGGGSALCELRPGIPLHTHAVRSPQGLQLRDQPAAPKPRAKHG